jgi:outer membrane protein assembly factor BamB
VFAATSIDLPSPPFFACLVRSFDRAEGELLWEATRTVASTACLPYDVDTDGKTLAISGIGGPGVSAFFIQAYDARTGAFLWEDRNAGSSTVDALVAVDAERRQVFATGWRSTRADNGTRREVFMVRSYDMETGVLRWESEFLEKPDEIATFLWHGSDVDIVRGRVFAVAYEASPRGRWLVRSLNLSDGRVVWEDFFEPEAPQSGISDYYYRLRLHVAVEEGRVFVVGSGGTANGNGDLILRAYDAK